MLAIRMKRIGRRGHAQFRVIVQDSHFHPSRGKVVAYLGSYNPHTKVAELDKDLAQKYLGNGAQPSDRVATLLKNEGVKLPSWVKASQPKSRAVRNPDKRRSTRPAEPAAETPPAEESVEAPAQEVASEPVGEEPAAAGGAEGEEAQPKQPSDEPKPQESISDQPADEAPTEESPQTPAEAAQEQAEKKSD